jgi:hypothetical protein
MTNRTLHAAQILWPAFFMASILEMLVFAWFDPAQVSIGAWHPSTQTTYSLAFLAFWALITAASGISHWMMSANQALEPAPEQRFTRRQARRQHAHNHP